MTEKNQSTHLTTETSWSHLWQQPKFDFLNSEHFNGERFFNVGHSSDKPSRTDLYKWLITRKSHTWNVDIQHEYEAFYKSIISLPESRPHASLDDWNVWFIGHATALIKIGPYNFLTDPVWSDYASPKQGVGPRRVCPAGIRLEDLPEIHGVLLSHNHYDHMDIATLKWLHEKFGMMIYTGLGNGYYLPDEFNVTELDWWESISFNELNIVYTPAQHGSGRGFRDQNSALWGGFSISNGKDHCYFAGDTGYATHFKEIKQKLGAPRIALLPIGAYEPRHILRYMHMNPEDAFQAHKDLHAKCSLAIHYRTFQLTDESRDQPEEDLHKAMKNSSKLVNPFYCIREGKKIIV
ncbi:Zn-dependent hydrolase [Acinetobacter sp. Ac_877]|uniref:MBL fold metallo-hydrolase n=1 Tax=Acinetobacter portensis TaxID=1839785 RepID=UPI00128E72F6|nr:MBL fold metallo-hydrolase [Acinetobacter portensis]MPW41974.1 Zn-dependent hydrolase [Acinetobacter portensis]